jgi:hypothetical protein
MLFVFKRKLSSETLAQNKPVSPSAKKLLPCPSLRTNAGSHQTPLIAHVQLFSHATPEPAPASMSGTLDDNSDDDGLDSTTRSFISKIAKCFGTTGELFLTDAEIFRQRCPKSFLGNITHSDHYLTSESTKEGIIAELYSVVPERLHETMQNDSVFGKTVRLN